MAKRLKTYVVTVERREEIDSSAEVTVTATSPAEAKDKVRKMIADGSDAKIRTARWVQDGGETTSMEVGDVHEE